MQQFADNRARTAYFLLFGDFSSLEHQESRTKSPFPCECLCEVSGIASRGIWETELVHHGIRARHAVRCCAAYFGAPQQVVRNHQVFAKNRAKLMEVSLFDEFSEPLDDDRPKPAFYQVYSAHIEEGKGGGSDRGVRVDARSWETRIQCGATAPFRRSCELWDPGAFSMTPSPMGS
jgi:hypothetical protein